MERDIRMIGTPSRSELPSLDEEQLLYLLLELAPGGAGDRARLPLDLCLLLDVSSSMRGERLSQVKEAARLILSQLTQEDYFCLITFNDHAEVVVPRQQVKAAAAIREHISEVQASGGTEMARGMEQVLEQMYRSTFFSGVRRLILLTDGQTYGDDDRCVELARQAQGAGIGITALGVGDEWNEDLLATMAAHGNSRSEYIAGPEAITEIFRDEMRLLQGIVAQDMSLTLRKASATVQQFVRVAPEINQMALKESWDSDQLLPLGEWMGSDVQSFLVEMTVPPLSPGNHHLLQVTFSYRLPREHARREVHYDLALPCVPEAGAGQVPDKVRHALEKVTALRLQEAAWQDVRRGNVDQATRRLEAAATRLVKMGEEDLARAVEAEVHRLQSTGRTSLVGKKEIRYGTQRLGRRSGRPDSRE